MRFMLTLGAGVALGYILNENKNQSVAYIIGNSTGSVFGVGLGIFRGIKDVVRENIK